MFQLIPLLLALTVPNIDPRSVTLPGPPDYIFQPSEAPMFLRTMVWTAPDYAVDRYEIFTRKDLQCGEWQSLDTTHNTFYSFGVYNDTRYFKVVAITPDNLYSE